MDKLPIYQSEPQATQRHTRNPWRKLRLLTTCALACSITYSVRTFSVLNSSEELSESSHLPLNAHDTLHKCNRLKVLPTPPKDFHLRTVSDRYEPGTPTVLLKNATIWTGHGPGFGVVHGDVLLSKGIVKAIGDISSQDLKDHDEVDVVYLNGEWVTPGIVDIHSHLGVDSAPHLEGSDDTNSLKGITQPWLRSLDGINTHDDAYRLSISGGVTTANILPGSANAIGGQAFPIKLRPTHERSVSSMLLEPPYSMDTFRIDPSLPPRWRQMKHACGENPTRVYSGSRMDTIWSFRQAYETARKIKQEQDDYCDRALAGDWNGLGAFPEDLQWEALVDVLRGRVKVHTHCYEATDLDGLVRYERLGHPPAVALFATNSRYKREAYRGSEFAPRILSDNDIQVIMKSDHPVLNSRHLLYEAQQAFYYGLSEDLAIASVTSTPAAVLGMSHRIGFIKAGYDAGMFSNIVIWDSHPLALGATPKQVYIDGIKQINNAHTVKKPAVFQESPRTPNFDKERADALKFDGLPPLEVQQTDEATVMFTNVGSLFVKNGSSISQIFITNADNKDGVSVLAHKGQVIVCSDHGSCPLNMVSHAKQIDLEGGSIAPALITFGSSLGLEHIEAEDSTNDGTVIDPLNTGVPSIVGGDGAIIRAVDGLQFSSRDALLAYRAGVTTGVVAPVSAGFLSGLSTYFDTGAPHGLSKSAVIQDVAALHVTIGKTSKPSVSTQIAALRNLLLGNTKGDLADQIDRVIEGEIPLVINAHGADVLASLIRLKEEVETETGSHLRIVFSGATEAHLLAKEIGQANIGVILNPSRPFPAEWRSRRILPGPPLTQKNALTVLMENHVTVGFGIEEKWSARNLRFDLAWAAIEAGNAISRTDALAVGSVNIEKLLGVNGAAASDLIATRSGTLLEFSSKVVAIISERKEAVELI
ncbi:hypothetical protein AMATHDRAFT_2992 [Amanita thiersii Skay4041]|uniref:Amidohydrolase-related domain-containing protein n=1 Tax=Amanita thiersii Skay4041 TaxID=703135 RepID=A0A2A9NTB4_9AGAR|nr:hypothetical protein AMATHDRAFT_2992 [Amanita thiersii Skay4041]